MEKTVLKIKDLPHDEKPREKLRKFGPQALKNFELLAVILGRGTKKEGVLELSRRLMKQYGKQAAFHEGDVGNLMRLFNISFVQACQVVACFELGRRLFSKEREIFLRSPEEVFEYVKEMFLLKKECLRGLYLDTRNKLIKDEIISIGTLDRSISHPREIFFPAVLYSAASIILVHNHPSGDPTPSPEDIEFTKRIKEASRIMDIELLDHIIVGNGRFVSLARWMRK